MWLVATLVQLVFSPHGVVGTALSVVATVSIVIWSLLEIARGDSPFRRVLGAVVLVAVSSASSCARPTSRRPSG